MDMIFDSIVILTVARNGQWIINSNLKHFNLPITMTQDALIETKDNQLVVIAKSSDTFDIIIDLICSKHIEKVGTFSVSQDEFNEHYWHVKCHQHISQNRFPSAVVVDLHLLMTDNKYLFQLFDVDKQTNYTQVPKFTNDAETRISNYSQLSSWYNDVSSQPLTQADLDSFVEMARTYPWKPVTID